MQAIRIVLVCIVGAIAFGVLHDQVTARICIEYFTLGHPRIIESQDPTILALTWGVVASWWIGAILGIALAIAARRGPLPRTDSSMLLGPIARLMLGMLVCSSLAGVLGWQLADRGVITLVGPLHDSVPAARHTPFIAVLWAHITSYAVGLVGGALLAWRTWLTRQQNAIRVGRVARVAPTSREGLPP